MDFKSKFVGAGMFILASLLAATIVLYDYSDLCFNVASDHHHANLLNHVSAVVADLLLQNIGLSVVILISNFLYTGIKLILGKEISIKRSLMWACFATININIVTASILEDAIYFKHYPLISAWVLLLKDNFAYWKGLTYAANFGLVFHLVYYAYSIKKRNTDIQSSKLLDESNVHIQPTGELETKKSAPDKKFTWIKPTKIFSKISKFFTPQKSKSLSISEHLSSMNSWANRFNNSGPSNSAASNNISISSIVDPDASSPRESSGQNLPLQTTNQSLDDHKHDLEFSSSLKLDLKSSSGENQDLEENLSINYDDAPKSNTNIETNSNTARTEQEYTYANFEHPPLEILRKTHSNFKSQSFEELNQNAEQLLKVLNDFGVSGVITDVHQGPVVTSYEFEPAPGIKASRIIGLADDVARSLSALSTRIAIMPGRNVLGIEVPNINRTFFNIRELMEFAIEQCSSMALPIILGRDHLGAPLVVDLAKMPHLLVAGTTGSGKSVGINTMIFSLLYRYSPAECKFIMIDPKMLELSVYADIPHLLTPVVTEAPKAVSALKWAVKEMESRYKMMSNLGVRNIDGYNTKVAEMTKTSPIIKKRVQIGFDSDGNPVHETIDIKLRKMPFIVIIVDEMADLMVVAGKDIEGLIQRLSQMARAAGIHIIMATQRPSVDVVTGVIKANFPSRVSFRVISKIDSRTILGQMGAEHLLGMGDMLFLGNTHKIARVHGPFVDDIEVEQLVAFLKSQGKPMYVGEVTNMPSDTSKQPARASNNKVSNMEDADNDLYIQAVEIVKRDKKPSISYVQRMLRIGYNKAAIMIERMEKEGIVSAPSISGKREVMGDD